MMPVGWLPELPLNPDHCWLLVMSLLASAWQCALLWLVYRALDYLIGLRLPTRFGIAMATLVLMGLTPIANCVWLSRSIERPAFIQNATTNYALTGHLRLYRVADLAPTTVSQSTLDHSGLETTALGEASPNDSLVAPSAHRQHPTVFGGAQSASHLASWIAGIHWPVVSVVLLTMAYAVGLISMALRLTFGLARQWRATRVLAKTNSKPSLPPQLRLLAEKAAIQFGKSLQTRIGLYRGHGTAIVVGIIRPTILLNFSLVSGLTPEQLQQVLTHELAHVYRRDPLTQLIQRLVESILFFHPLVWRLSREVSQLREMCCDEFVIHSHPSIEYAQTLLRCSQLNQTSTRRFEPQLTLAATGSHSGQLKQRILWLLDDSHGSGRPKLGNFLPDKVRGLCITLSAVAMSVLVWICQPPGFRASENPANSFVQVAEATQPEWPWSRVEIESVDSAALLFGGRVLTLTQQMPDDVKVAISSGENPLRFAQWQFGDFESTSISILVEVADGALQSIYLDKNRDRVIDEDERIEHPASGKTWFTDLDVEIRESDQLVHVGRQIALTLGRNGKSIRVTTLGHADGILEVNERNVAVRRIDRDGNGLATDIRDQVCFDLNADGQFDTLTERHAVRPVIELEGQRYGLLSDRLGQTLRLNADREHGQILFAFAPHDPNATLRSLEGSLRDENGMVVAIRSDDLNVEVPVGHYAIENLVIQVQDASGSLWSVTLSSAADQSWFQVRANQLHEVQLLESLEFQMKPVIRSNSWDGSDSHLEPSLRTATGLVVTNFACDDPKVSRGWDDSVVAHFQLSNALGESRLDDRPALCTSGFG